MQWWCSAGQGPWTWTPIIYPGVWIVMGFIAYTYWRLSRGPETPRRDRVLGWIGVVALDAALEWPLGPLAAGYLATAHAVQFLIVVLTAPPLILFGVRHRMALVWPTNGKRERFLHALLNPVLAAVAFNIIVIGTHVPAVNDTLMASQLGAFGVDAAWFIAGLWFWWPILVRVPARPLFIVPMQMLYFFLGTLAHEGIAIVMLMHDHPMYGVYELAPRATGMSALTDIKLAGGIMELGAAALVFGILTVMFFRWIGGTGAERPTPK